MMARADSRLTPDFINPEKPWPHLDKLQCRTEAKGNILRQRLPVYPEFIPALAKRGGFLLKIWHSPQTP